MKSTVKCASSVKNPNRPSQKQDVLFLVNTINKQIHGLRSMLSADSSAAMLVKKNEHQNDIHAVLPRIQDTHQNKTTKFQRWDASTFGN